MKRCPSCGQETRDDSQEFCTRCGAYFVTGHQGPAKIGQTGMDMPEDPVERGMALMDVGSFGEAVRIWDGAVRSGTVVDDIMYRRMVDSAAGCMLGTVMQPQMYASAPSQGAPQPSQPHSFCMVFLLFLKAVCAAFLSRMRAKGPSARDMRCTKPTIMSSFLFSRLTDGFNALKRGRPHLNL